MPHLAPVVRLALPLVATLILAVPGPLPAQMRSAAAELRLTPPGSPSASSPSAATDGGHRFAVAWLQEDASGKAVAGRLLDTETGGTTSFEATTVAPQVELSRPAVEVFAQNDLEAIVAWGELRNGSEGCVLTRWILELGPRRTTPHTISCAPATAAPQVAVATTASDGYAVAWAEPAPAGGPTAVFFLRVDENDEPIGGRVRVWPRGPGAQTDPQIAVDGRGEFLVAWRQPAADGRPRLLARRFGSSGAALGRAFEIDTDFLYSDDARVAMAADSRFAAAWDEGFGGFGAIHARLYEASGVLQRGLRVPRVELEENGVGRPDIAMDSRGNSAVAWQSGLPETGGTNVSVTLFNQAGFRHGGFELSDDETAGRQGAPAVALADGGTVLVAWETRQPGQATEIHARIVNLPPDEDVCVYRGDVFRCHEEEEIRFGAGTAAGDRPFLADLDGDGDDDPCVRRGNAFLCDTAHDGGGAEIALAFGTAAQVPLLGDLDGDGFDNACVRRGSTFLCDTARDGGRAETRVRFGRSSETPLLGDVDGDGDDDPCVFRPASGVIACDASHDGVEDLVLPLGPVFAGDQPLLGNVDGDGRDDACVRRDVDILCGSSLTRINFAPLRRGDVALLGDLDNF